MDQLALGLTESDPLFAAYMRTTLRERMSFEQAKKEQSVRRCLETMVRIENGRARRCRKSCR